LIEYLREHCASGKSGEQASAADCRPTQERGALWLEYSPYSHTSLRAVKKHVRPPGLVARFQASSDHSPSSKHEAGKIWAREKTSSRTENKTPLSATSAKNQPGSHGLMAFVFHKVCAKPQVTNLVSSPSKMARFTRQICAPRPKSAAILKGDSGKPLLETAAVEESSGSAQRRAAWNLAPMATCYIGIGDTGPQANAARQRRRT